MMKKKSILILLVFVGMVVTIQPALAPPAVTEDWVSAGGGGDYAYLGYSVATAGDVNGDGFSDVIMGAPTSGSSNNGAAYVYYGSASGLPSSASWSIFGPVSHGRFGASVSSAGDVNGDGYDDVVIGAHAYDYDPGNGRAYVYYGSASGLSSSSYWYVEHDQTGNLFGSAVSGAGDVNGDGYDDIIIGAQWYNPDKAAVITNSNHKGGAFVYYGSGSGVSNNVSLEIVSTQLGSKLGASVSGAGDVNGDGYDDIIIGAREYDNGNIDEGAAFLYYGSSNGLASGLKSVDQTTAVWSTEGDKSNARFGKSVANAGDVNGDGYADIVIGADNYAHDSSPEGGAFVYHGGPMGPSETPNWIGRDYELGSRFGTSVGGAGDVNNDGYDDLVIGAPEYSYSDRGRIFVYYGRAIGLSPYPVWSAFGTKNGEYNGYSVAVTGDIDGDGYDDIISGAYGYGASYGGSGPRMEGHAYVYYGSSVFWDLSLGWQIEGFQADHNVGSSVASAGDVNADGFDDILIGVPGYDDNQGAVYVYNGGPYGPSSFINVVLTGAQHAGGGEYPRFGGSIASAGDVNGDGYDDVIVGSRGYDVGLSGGGYRYDEGRVYVFYGSASGLTWNYDWTTSGGQDHAYFGTSVAGAGDVNGDGYDDVIIGAYQYENGQSDEGRAFVFYGSATGLASSASWTAESNVENGHFGTSVASAGDINADGYADVVVGKNGGAYVYHGSSTGLSSTPTWSTDSEPSGSHIGSNRVAGVGDINNDGYSDIIVGAAQYRNEDSYQLGAVYVYHGSASGLPGTPNLMLTGLQSFSGFGGRIAGAKDINRDGYDDVLIAASGWDDLLEHQGAVNLYLGSASGLTDYPIWSMEGDQENAYLGSIAGAGDVNGDGNSDILVGAGSYDNTETASGTAYFYFGSCRPGGVFTCPPITRVTHYTLPKTIKPITTIGPITKSPIRTIIWTAQTTSTSTSTSHKVVTTVIPLSSFCCIRSVTQTVYTTVTTTTPTFTLIPYTPSLTLQPLPVTMVMPTTTIPPRLISLPPVIPPPTISGTVTMAPVLQTVSAPMTVSPLLRPMNLMILPARNSTITLPPPISDLNAPVIIPAMPVSIDPTSTPPLTSTSPVGPVTTTSKTEVVDTKPVTSPQVIQTVEKTVTETETNGGPTPGFSIIMGFLAMLVLGLWKKRR